MPIKKRGPLHPHQKGLDGPLSDEFQARLQRLRIEGNLSLAKLANELGISGTFLSNLLRHDAHVRTVHVPRFVTATERLESELGISGGSNEDASVPDTLAAVSIEELIRYANRQGFAVTFTPLEQRPAIQH